MLINQGFFFHQAHNRAACSDKKPESAPPAPPAPKKGEEVPEDEQERGDLFKSDGPGAGGGYAEAAGEDGVSLSDEARKRAEEERRREEPIYEIEGPGAGGGYLRRPEDDDSDEVSKKSTEPAKENNEKK